MNFLEVNNRIANILESGAPASILRIDNTAGYVMQTLHEGGIPISQFFNEGTLLEAGIYPSDIQHAYKIYGEDTIEIMHRATILGFVDISGQIMNSSFASQFEPKEMFAGGESFYVMDPGALMGCHSTLPKPEVPWTSKLKGKRVLVVSTHAESIKSQWQKIDSIWGSNKERMTPFELVGVVRAPYHPLVDSRTYPDCNTWEESVEYMKKLIDAYDYDVLLTGSTVSSPFFADHAMNRGKVGIQTGGAIQLLFGIYGYRWTQVPGHSGWHSMYNEHWTYPLQIDEPMKRGEMGSLESAKAYWR